MICASNIQKAFNTKNTKLFYSLIRRVFGPPTSSVTPLKSKDGAHTIKEPSKILQRWEEHFTDLFDHHSPVDYNVLESLPQRETAHRMDRHPTLEEVREAIQQINSDKAPGVDGIPIELLKIGSPNVTTMITKLIIDCWNGSPIPQDWIDGILLSLYKHALRFSHFSFW